jgi:hypothetical protein
MVMISMEEIAPRREERKTLGVQMECMAIQENLNLEDEDIVTCYHKLQVDEKKLQEQKEHLRALLNQLEAKARDEVDKKKRKVERLNSEVSDLKRKCEKFATWVNSEPASERTQSGL